MINYSLATMFMKLKNVLSFMKFREKMYELLDKFVKEINERNIV